jgi:DNA-binding winged helix-turn-helix (wHTH) protein/TolB-like protein/Flp pilus assembly protein TadD
VQPVTANRYKFRGFEIDVSRRLLRATDGDPISLTSKVFDLLLYLVANAGRTLNKDELMSAIWPDTVVEESNLTQNISILRKALGDVRGENAFIATIPGQGYRFVAEVESVTPAAAEVAVQQPEEVRGPDVSESKRTSFRFAIAGLVGILIIAGVIAVLYAYRASDTSASSDPRVLAILPFKPVIETDSDKALEVGMADTLIARMSNTPGVILRPLSSVRKFSAPDQDPQTAGRELAADAVLDGTIQRDGEKIRVNVRLTDVATGQSLWGGTFDEQYRDIFSVQDTISTKVAEALRVRLGGPAHFADRGTNNVEAYRLYLQGRLFQFRATRNEIYQAIGFYRDAIKLDPGYALAYAGMADALRTLPITSDVDPRSAFPESKAAAEKALQINPDLSQARVALGYVASWYEWDWKKAEDEMRRAVQLDQQNEEAHRALSILLTLLGRHDEAVNEMRRARELAPLSLPTNALEAQALFYAGRDEEALERLNKTFEIDPEFWIARLMLARILIKQSRFDEALVELARARTASGGNSETISLIGYVQAKKGNRAEALEALRDLEGYKKDTYSPSYNIAMVYHGLGRTDDALAALEDAAERRDVRLMLINVEHKWDGLRDNPRFLVILHKLNFPAN